jgi:hypothetical protein
MLLASRERKTDIKIQSFSTGNVMIVNVLACERQSVSGCWLIYSGFHLGQIDNCDFILVLRSKPRRSLALEKCADVEGGLFLA